MAGAVLQVAAETMIQRGKYIGRLVGQAPTDEAGHLIRCPACGGWTHTAMHGE